MSQTSRFSAAALYRLVVVTVLGFASGLPLALTGQAMQADARGQAIQAQQQPRTRATSRFQQLSSPTAEQL